jgi:hypothetical protein
MLRALCLGLLLCALTLLPPGALAAAAPGPGSAPMASGTTGSPRPGGGRIAGTPTAPTPAPEAGKPSPPADPGKVVNPYDMEALRNFDADFHRPE